MNNSSCYNTWRFLMFRRSFSMNPERNLEEHITLPAISRIALISVQHFWLVCNICESFPKSLFTVLGSLYWLHSCRICSDNRNPFNIWVIKAKLDHYDEVWFWRFRHGIVENRLGQLAFIWKRLPAIIGHIALCSHLRRRILAPPRGLAPGVSPGQLSL